MKRLAHRLDDCSRRSFISGAARAMLGVTLLPMLAPLAKAAEAGSERAAEVGLRRRPTARNCAPSP